MASYVHVQALESCLGWHSKEIKTNVWRNPTRKQSPAYISCFQYLVVKTTTQGQLCKVNYGDKENETWLDFMLVYQTPPPPIYPSIHTFSSFLMLSFMFLPGHLFLVPLAGTVQRLLEVVVHDCGVTRAVECNGAGL